MIEQFGMGIDICNINKFKKKPFKDNERFYKKIFSTSEVNYCIKFKNHHEKFAAKFAIKEALVKSINEKINFQDIETIYQKWLRRFGIALVSGLRNSIGFVRSWI